jgi:hypothetical protein
MLVDIFSTIQIHKQTTYVNELILAMTMFNRTPITLLLIQIADIQLCRKSSFYYGDFLHVFLIQEKQTWNLEGKTMDYGC